MKVWIVWADNDELYEFNYTVYLGIVMTGFPTFPLESLK